MSKKSGFPFAELHFDAGGALHSATGPLVSAGTTDLVVIAHGWKNSGADAHRLYGSILAHVRAAAGAALADEDREWAAVGVFWPAFRFQEDLSILPSDGTAAVMGGAAGLTDQDVDRADLLALAKDFADASDAPDADGFAADAMDAAGGGAAADRFLDRLRDVLPASSHADGTILEEHHALLNDGGRNLYQQLRQGGIVAVAEATDAPPDAAPEPAAGLSAVGQRLRSLRTGGRAAIARMLNQATYFTMKARAGRTGRALAGVLSTQVPPAVRIHLVGHSFGGRLVTAAAADDVCPPLRSLSLLQAAYSHNGLGTGFGDDRRIVGAFRPMIDRRTVEGPILVTHTLNDRAVGLAYAIASAASGTIAAGLGINALLGGPDDPHGGMGANGARSMKPGETIDLVTQKGSVPALRTGVVNNVLSDAIVSDHNDVENEHVGALVWAALAAR